MGNKLNFQVEANNTVEAVSFDLRKIFCIGFASRDTKKALEHILELEKIGVKRPEKIPTIYPCSAILLTQDNKIQVVDGKSSGEVEFAILLKGGDIYIGLCSDHTDRLLETVSIEKSKQVCPKPIAKVLWKYEEIKSHWDELVLSSWVTANGEEKLYQSGKVDSILKVEDILKVVAEEYIDVNDTVMYSGTIPTREGLIYGEKFRYEIVDAVLGRKISHEYEIEVLLNEN